MKTLKKRNFKGFIGDMRIAFIFFLVIPVIMASTVKTVSIQWCAVAANTINSVPANAPSWTQGYQNSCGANGVGNIINAFNYIIPLWVLGAGVAVLVYAAFLKSSPILFGAGFIYLCVDMFVSFYMSNAIYKIVTTAPISQGAVSFPSPLYLVAYEPILIGVLIAIYLLVGITKYRSGEFQQQSGVPLW